VRHRPKGGYREVLRDRVFLRFALINFAVVGGAIALLNGLFPVYARDEVGVDERTIGLLFLLNSLIIIAAQLPVARRQAGRRRMASFGLMAVLFAVAWLLVLAAGSLEQRAVALLVLAILVISAAECIYDAVQGPLTADFAREGLTGRYMAVNGFSWQLGFILGPALGAVVLGAEPTALWLLAAAVCSLAAVASLSLERRLPRELVRSPG
jgi:predicted MFS family arabinose efflux permease